MSIFSQVPKYKNLAKQTFGRLKPLRKIGTKHDCALWLCLCYCGNLCEVTSGQLKRKKGSQLRCGKCYDNIKYPAEYTSWRHMIQRCTDKNCKDYHNYGGRGIVISSRWQHDFLFFLEDMGFRPEGDFTLDRKDTNGNYEKENCHWLHRTFQNMNRRGCYEVLEPSILAARLSAQI